MKKKGNYFIGILIILIGTIILFERLNVIDISFGSIIGKYWAAIFIMLPGLIFHYSYFTSRKNEVGLLIPGGILVTIGITLQLSASFNIWHLLWPGYILAIAIGLFEYYIFGEKNKGLLIPIVVIGGMAIVFFTGALQVALPTIIRKLLLPSILIVFGIYIILADKIKKKQKKKVND